MDGPDITGDELIEARTPDGPVDLDALGSQLLDEARGSSSGTAAISLVPTDVKAFTQTLIAVTRGSRLDAQHWNGPASVQIVAGGATVTDDGSDAELGAGQWTRLLAGSGVVRADADLVVLLTVAPA